MTVWAARILAGIIPLAMALILCARWRPPQPGPPPCPACVPGPNDGLCTCTSGCGSDLCGGCDHTTLAVLSRADVQRLRDAWGKR